MRQAGPSVSLACGRRGDIGNTAELVHKRIGNRRIKMERTLCRDALDRGEGRLQQENHRAHTLDSPDHRAATMQEDCNCVEDVCSTRPVFQSTSPACANEGSPVVLSFRSVTDAQAWCSCIMFRTSGHPQRFFPCSSPLPLQLGVIFWELLHRCSPRFQKECLQCPKRSTATHL